MLKRKLNFTSTSTTQKKGANKKTKDDKAPAKLPYDLTDEELKEKVDADVKRQLAPKRPEPKEIIPEETVKKFVRNLSGPPSHVANRPSDYN